MPVGLGKSGFMLRSFCACFCSESPQSALRVVRHAAHPWNAGSRCEDCSGRRGYDVERSGQRLHLSPNLLDATHSPIMAAEMLGITGEASDSCVARVSDEIGQRNGRHPLRGRRTTKKRRTPNSISKPSELNHLKNYTPNSDKTTPIGD